MTLQEAIITGLPFRRSTLVGFNKNHYITVEDLDEAKIQLRTEDMLANDWEVQRPSPKKKRKVKVWIWETISYGDIVGWMTHISQYHSEKPPLGDNWFKVLESEREIEIEEDIKK